MKELRKVNTATPNNRKRKAPYNKRILVITAALLVLAALVVAVVSGCSSSSGDTADGTLTDSKKALTDVTVSSDTEDEPIYPVSRAEYTDSTAEFSDDFSFSNGLLIDLDSNRVLAAKDAEKRIYPASLTKIMTLIVAVENCADLDDTFVMTSELIDPLIIENASVAGFAPGEAVTVRDMLYGLMLPSGADAAAGLAEYVAGSEAEFAKLMNDKAAELGMLGTHFVNASGLHDEDHYSTCHEVALMLRYAMENETMRQILTTYQYTTESTEQNPEGILLTSTMFSRMYGDEPECAFIIGGKTGYTIEAKNCLASFAVRCDEGEDEELIYSREPSLLLVTVGSADKWGPVYDAIDIYSTFADETAEVGDVVTKLR